MERAQREELWKVTDEAYRLYDDLREVSRATVATDERHIKALTLMRRAADRISRREYRLKCAHNDVPAVTTAQIAAWVRGRIDVYVRFGEVDPAEIAGDACNAFGLWDAHGSIPAWVWGLCERVGPRAAQEAMRQRAFFVEKPVRYEPDGDCLWA